MEHKVETTITNEQNKKAGCHECGLKYGGAKWIEAVVPDSVWEMIKPEGCAEGAGLLCISCMAGRIRNLGLDDVPVIFSGMEPFQTVQSNLSYPARLALLRNYNHE